MKKQLSKASLRGFTALWLGLFSLPIAAQPHSSAPRYTAEMCLVSAIYYEANTQSFIGKRAVYEIVVNRAMKQRKNVCQIVMEKGQFSWWPTKPMIIRPTQAQRNELQEIRISDIVLASGEFQWFFNTSIKRPAWAKRMACTGIDEHLFCRKTH